MFTENVSKEEKGNGVLADVIRSIKNFFKRNKPKKLKESYHKNELNNELTIKLRDFVNNMPEFETSPFIVCQKENQKGFGVFSDNGHGNQMKRFTIIIEDHKSF
jgi:hypothetical protein